MATASPENQRALRRRRRRERQAVVFGSLVAGLAIAGLGATAIYTGAMSAPFLEREFTTPAPEPTAENPSPPCIGQDVLPVAYAEIEVQVLNGTATAGLAGTVAGDLDARGFDIVGTGNYSGGYPGRVQILFGQAGLEAAYTLAAHFEDPVLLLDLREGGRVDVVLGTGFLAMLEEELVELQPEVPLEQIAGCVPLEDALLVASPAPVADGDSDGESTEEEPQDGAPEEGEDGAGEG